MESLHRRFRRWVQSGVFDRLLNALRDDLDWQIVMVDGAFVEVHQHGAGPEKRDAPRMKADKPKPSAGAGAG